MTHVMACIDGSRATLAVCDYGAWAALKLAAPLTFLHVLDRDGDSKKDNLSGSIGLGAQEALLEQLVSLDEQRSRLALQQGKLMLAGAVERATEAGVTDALTRQRHGDLISTLTELSDDIRLLVIGKQGEEGDQVGRHLGSHVERVIRTLHRPVLITQEDYKVPQQVMLAFDGSATARRAVELVAASPLLRDLTCHVVMVGNDSSEQRAQLEWAKQSLQAAGHEVVSAMLSGDVETTLESYQAEQQIDLLVMGAYGHSRIRQFFVGSTTNNMIIKSAVPVLVLR